ncbi:hypothetical protein R6Q59_010013 [Mikania micrantha]
MMFESGSVVGMARLGKYCVNLWFRGSSLGPGREAWVRRPLKEPTPPGPRRNHALLVLVEAVVVDEERERVGGLVCWRTGEALSERDCGFGSGLRAAAACCAACVGGCRSMSKEFFGVDAIGSDVLGLDFRRARGK